MIIDDMNNEENEIFIDLEENLDKILKYFKEDNLNNILRLNDTFGNILKMTISLIILLDNNNFDEILDYDYISAITSIKNIIKLIGLMNFKLIIQGLSEKNIELYLLNDFLCLILLYKFYNKLGLDFETENYDKITNITNQLLKIDNLDKDLYMIYDKKSEDIIINKKDLQYILNFIYKKYRTIYDETLTTIQIIKPEKNGQYFHSKNNHEFPYLLNLQIRIRNMDFENIAYKYLLKNFVIILEEETIKHKIIDLDLNNIKIAKNKMLK
jgi:hypothetical protein